MPPPPDRNGKVPSWKQIKARERNWYIRKLRAYFHLCPILGKEGEKIRRIIDREIRRVKAEPEGKRAKHRQKEFEKQYQEYIKETNESMNFPEMKYK